MWFRLFHRRYLISLTYLIITVIGVVAWQSIALEMAPKLNLPSITVSYSWGSTSPQVVEKEITRKVEQAANRLQGVKKIRSVTEEGRSTVTITFAESTPVDYRIVELQEYLAALEKSLPKNVRHGSISRRVPKEISDMQTFIVYSISGQRPVHDLLEYARRNIRLKLLGLSGLAGIEMNGARAPAIMVEFNTDRLEKFSLSPRGLLGQINRDLQWRSAGYTRAQGKRISLLVPPQIKSIRDIKAMPIALPKTDKTVHLYEIANVSIQDYPATTLRRINGSPALTIHFMKESGADAIALGKTIRSKIAEIKKIMPAGITLQLEQDATEQLRKQFGELRFQTVISLLVVFLVLLFFIRRFRAPFVILGSILFSLLLSVMVLYFMHYTLNVITLAGLTVALGMIVDNAVVVFEELNPELPASREQRFSHIKKELPRTIVPVLGGTLTTVGIFIPVLFTLKELQLFLIPLAVALSFTLISSVLIALTWIPYALIWLVPERKAVSKPSFLEMPLKYHHKSPLGRGLGWVYSYKQRYFKGFFKYFRRPALWFFTWRHKLRWPVYIGLILLVGLPLFAIEEPDREDPDGSGWPEFTKIYFNNRADIDPWIGGLTYRFFNETYFGDPWGGWGRGKTIYVTIETPQGTPLEKIDKMARNFEKIVRPYEEAFTYYETYVSEYYGARLQFHIKEKYLTEPEPYIFYAEAMFLAARTGNSAISVSGLLGQGISTGFGGAYGGQQITLTGYSYQKLLQLAKDLRHRLKQNRRVRGVDISGSGFFSRGDLHQYYLQLRDEALAARGLNRSELYRAIALDVNPENTFGRVNLNGRRMFLIGRNQARQQYPAEFMQEKRIAADDSVMFSIAQIGRIEKQKSQAEIHRVNQEYTRVVTVDFLGPAQLAQDYIKGVLEKTPVPVGMGMEYGRSFFSFDGEGQGWNILLLLALTILTVWMITSAVLESWLDPLVVILIVPLSLLGVMAGSLWHDLTFGRGAIAGTLLCVGVVVNNGILLMHEKDKYRQLGIHGLRSWLYVYKNHTRAVLITTLTTIGGLVPIIVLGESTFWSQLAIVTTWGLGIGTLLLLLLMGLWEKTVFINNK